MFKQFRLAAATLAAALLAACGGGSDSDAGAPANTTYNVRAAWQQLMGSGGSWTVAGTGNDNLPYQIALSYTPAGRGTFALDNQAHDVTTQVLTLRQGGNSSDTVTQSVYHDLSTATPVGTRVEGECSLAAVADALPTAARAGEAGRFFRLTDYDGCTTATAVGVADISWSVERNGGLAYYCLTTRYVTAGGLEIECIEAVGTDGRLGSRARVRYEIPVGGVTFVVDATN